MKVLRFNIVFERDEDGYYVAWVPSLSGCHTQGKTLEVAKKRIKEAIELYIEDEPDAVGSDTGFIGIDSVTVHA